MSVRTLARLLKNREYNNLRMEQVLIRQFKKDTRIYIYTYEAYAFDIVGRKFTLCTYNLMTEQMTII